MLGELAGKTDAAGNLGLVSVRWHGRQASQANWNVFFSSIEPVDHHFYLRLGKVFEAAATSLPADRFFCQQWFDNARWLELLLQSATGRSVEVYGGQQTTTAITATLIEQMLKADGRTIEPFISAAFKDSGKKWGDGKARGIVLAVANIGKTIADHHDLLAEYFLSGPAASREIAVENLARSGAPAKVFIKELVACAMDSSKILREAAEPLVRSEPEAARPLLEQAARDPKAEKREQAVRLLGRIYSGSVRALLEELAASERSAAVKEAIASALRELDSQAGAPDAVLEPPSHEPIPLDRPVTHARCDVAWRSFLRNTTLTRAK